MITVGDFYDFIDGFAPFHTAMGFDNPGLLVGGRGASVRKVLFALDITPEVVHEAVAMDAQLIVSHHPVIFEPLKSLAFGSAPYLLAQNGIAAICAHTNLDMAQGGVNTCLAERLQLKNVRMLKEYEHSGLPEGLIGETDHPYSPEEFAAFVKQALGCDGLKYTDGGREITAVGLCGGSGAYLFPEAAAKGAQAMVTADTKHNQLLEAEDMGMTIVDAGHFYTEDVVIQPLLERMQVAFPGVEMMKSVRMHSPARFL
ncbi:Nif3-like dinuclear metal center hexameric protein [Clostridium sp. D33t1_170424_F3]|uniref:Nif3-like dinuclear metal center hexameric protein n=1 Tax=Clostridium sp. D33t1_170424_F3 TaxID=2787099 RepID=UPI001A9AED6E|nr:Nif3-like dinuclear metal center hexameric protein [Clostridium sp. D33t1_170424_F3]